MTEYEQQADELQEQSDKLGEEIADAREDWERKKADHGVPGAHGRACVGSPSSRRRSRTRPTKRP